MLMFQSFQDKMKGKVVRSDQHHQPADRSFALQGEGRAAALQGEAEHPQPVGAHHRHRCGRRRSRHRLHRLAR